MEGYSVTEAASVLGVPTERVWELLARGVLSGVPDGETGMRVFLQPRPAPAVVEEPRRSNGGGAAREPEAEASPFRELLSEFRNLTERYGQALLALGESRGEVASLRSRVDLLEARFDLRLPMSGSTTAQPAAATGWNAPQPAPPRPMAEPIPAEDASGAVEAEPAPPRRRRRGQHRATDDFAEALARAEDPSPAELPGGEEAAAAFAALRDEAAHRTVDHADAALPRELPAAEPIAIIEPDDIAEAVLQPIAEAEVAVEEFQEHIAEPGMAVEEASEPIAGPEMAVEEAPEPSADAPGVELAVEEAPEPIAEAEVADEEAPEPIAEAEVAVEEAPEPIAEAEVAVEETLEPIAEAEVAGVEVAVEDAAEPIDSAEVEAEAAAEPSPEPVEDAQQPPTAEPVIAFNGMPLESEPDQPWYEPEPEAAEPETETEPSAETAPESSWAEAQHEAGIEASSEPIAEAPAAPMGQTLEIEPEPEHQPQLAAGVDSIEAEPDAPVEAPMESIVHEPELPTALQADEEPEEPSEAEPASEWDETTRPEPAVEAEMVAEAQPLEAEPEGLTDAEPSWDRDRYTARIEEPDWIPEEWSPEPAATTQPETGRPLADARRPEPDNEGAGALPSSPEAPWVGEPDTSTPTGEETMLWFGREPNRAAPAWPAEDDSAAEMEVASTGGNATRPRVVPDDPISFRPAPAVPPAELPDIRAEYRASLRSQPPSPASRAYRRLRRIFPG